jgi:hypothetical protein
MIPIADHLTLDDIEWAKKHARVYSLIDDEPRLSINVLSETAKQPFRFGSFGAYVVDGRGEFLSGDPGGLEFSSRDKLLEMRAKWALSDIKWFAFRAMLEVDFILGIRRKVYINIVPKEGD